MHEKNQNPKKTRKRAKYKKKAVYKRPLPKYNQGKYTVKDKSRS